MSNKFVAWMLVMIWSLCIFAFSSDNGQQSSHKSKRVVEKVVKVSEKVFINNNVKISSKGKLEHYIRKLAHMTEYLILAILLCYAFKATGLRVQGQVIYTILFILIYASLDEYHQTFVPGRDGHYFDVIIDMFGGIIGIIIYGCIRKNNRIKKGLN